MMETKQQDIGEQLQAAVLQAALPAEDDAPFNVDEWRREALARQKGEAVDASSGEQEKRAESEQKARPRAVSPLTGAPTPPGRPKGVKNRLTNLRDAVLEAFDTVGGPAYLVQLAQGTQSDRAAFVGLVSKVLPTQVQAQVEGGVQIQLSWLGSRQIGTTVAQQPEQITQVVDLQRDSAGKYRIIDPIPGAEGAGAPAGSSPQEPAGDAQGG